MSTRRAVLCLAVVLTAFTAAAQPRITLRDGILVHPTEGVAYAMTPDGGIAAVDLTTGVAQWTTKNAAKPLLLVGNRLLAQIQPATTAQRDDLLLAALNASDRGKLLAKGGLDLPDEVVATVTESPAGHFVIAARRLDADTASVRWEFLAAQRRGHHGEEEEDRPASRPLPIAAIASKIREILGDLRINLSTGAIGDVQDTEKAVPTPDDFLVPNSDTDDQPGTQYTSADGRTDVTCVRAGDDSEWNNYRWTVIDATSGDRLGEIRTFVAFAPFVVRGGVLVLETKPFIHDDQAEPAKLRGYDLATGNEKWNYPVRETVFRGQTPP